MILSFKEYIIENKLSKAYGKGLAKSTQDKRKAQFKKQMKHVAGHEFGG
jgi:hypothetical protein